MKTDRDDATRGSAHHISDRISRGLALFASLLALSTPAAFADSFAQPTTGTVPLGSYSGGPFDTVNLANLNVHFSIPIVSKAGKGIPFNYSLSYDSLVWGVNTDSQGRQQWSPVANLGWRGVTEAATGYVTNSYTAAMEKGCGDGVNKHLREVWSNFVYHDALGGMHPFRGTIQLFESEYGDCDYTFASAIASDNSGYVLKPGQVQSGSSSLPTTILSSSGITITPPSSNNTSGNGTVTDPNGNTLTIEVNGSVTTLTDTLGTTALTVSGSPPSNPPSCSPAVTYTYTAPNSGPAAITVSYKPYTVQTTFGISNIGEFPPTSACLVDKITLPDTTNYQFTYEWTYGTANSVTGRIAQVTLPTGGTIGYDYNGWECHYRCNAMMADGSPVFMYRSLGGGTWSYFRGIQSGSNQPAQTTTVVMDPAGNETDLNFSSLYVTYRSVYQGTGTAKTLLSHVSTCYNGGRGQSCETAAVSAPITEQTVFDHLNNATFNYWVAYDYFYDLQYGLLTQETDYDYKEYPTNGIIKQTNAYYDHTLARCRTLGICDRPSYVRFLDGASNQKALTNNTYDGKGNAIQADRWVSGSTYLTSRSSYNANGTLLTSTDPNGTTATYSYAGNSCNSAFPTSISVPSEFWGTLTTTYAYNCTGGVVTSVTDPNNQSVSTSYTDPYFWRPASTTDQLGNVTRYNYYNVNNSGSSAVTMPGQVESVMIWNGGNSTTDGLATPDGYNRPLLQQNREAPGSATWDTVEYFYDTSGRVQYVNRPFASTAGAGRGGIPATGYTYDALGRVTDITDYTRVHEDYSYNLNDTKITVSPAPGGENTKSRQLEYDALGRLRSVCEITSGSGSGPCSQNTAATGFFSSYSYDPLGNPTGVSQSGQVRSFTYDGLSRMLSEAHPESGTASYAYDSDPLGTCSGTFPGDKVRRTDAANNNTCYTWDGLHRPTAVTYKGPEGNAASTQNKYYTYDLGRPGQGIAASNPLGRLVFAYAVPGNGWGNIVSVNSDKCADVVHVGESNGSLIQQWDCLGVNQFNQRWILNPVGANLYQIISENTGKCLDVRGASKSDGAPIQQWDCLGVGQTNQVWSLVAQGSSYQIVSENSGKCLDVTGVSKSDGALLQQYTCLGSGQLNQLWTLTGNSGSAINWSGFSYDKRGTATDFWEAGSHGHEAYHTVNSLAPNGAVSARSGYLWDAVAGRDTSRFTNALAYSFDGKGRPDGLTDQTTGDEIWAHSAYHTRYNPADQPDLLVFFPSADAEQFSWDPNSGRMASWQSILTTRGMSQSGTLTWNANGTLRRLQIHDDANAANNQTCGYLYDDLARVGSVDCGSSVWKQNFGYDVFGNIRKTVPQGSQGSSFAAAYSTSTNRVSNLGFSYDADGNVLNDNLFNIFLYDAEGRQVNVNAFETVFDAFNRPVAIQNPSSYYQVVYAPDGYKLAIMNGPSVVRYTAPLAAGIQAVYTGNSPAGVAYWRHADWLGSSRLASTRAANVYYDGSYAPFGENYAEMGTWDRSFTGQQQDTSSGLYDFELRQQSSNQGRWFVPDPAGLAAVDINNPQSWNRYAYVGNNPLSNRDPFGLEEAICDLGLGSCEAGGGGFGFWGGDASGWGGGGDCWLCLGGGSDGLLPGSVTSTVWAPGGGSDELLPGSITSTVWAPFPLDYGTGVTTADQGGGHWGNLNVSLGGSGRPRPDCTKQDCFSAQPPKPRTPAAPRCGDALYGYQGCSAAFARCDQGTFFKATWAGLVELGDEPPDGVAPIVDWGKQNPSPAGRGILLLSRLWNIKNMYRAAEDYAYQHRSDCDQYR